MLSRDDWGLWSVSPGRVDFQEALDAADLQIRGILEGRGTRTFLVVESAS